MGHAGARGTFISLFIVLKPVAMMRKKEVENIAQFSKHRYAVSALGSSNSDNHT